MRAVLLVLVACVWLSGCQPPDDPNRIQIWHQKTGAEREFFEQVIDEYNDANPSTRVDILYRETEELRNLFVIAAAGGKGPEMVFGPSDNVSIFAMTGAVQPISNFLSTDFLDGFDSDGLLDWEGEKWMIADQVGNHLTFVYNKQIIAEPPGTLDEMVQALIDATVDTNGDGRPDQFGLTWNYSEPFFFIPFLSGFGGRVMDDEGNITLDTPETVAAIRFILKLRDEEKVIPGSTDYDTAETLFKEGRAGAIINGPWSWAGYAKSGIDYGIARIPYHESTGMWCSPFVSSKGYSVNANVTQEKAELVSDVLRYLTGAGMQTRMANELATIPVVRRVRQSEAVTENDILQASLRQVEVGIPMPVQPQMRQVWDGMRGPYQLVMNGAVSPEEGARLMQQEVEKRIADTFL